MKKAGLSRPKKLLLWSCAVVCINGLLVTVLILQVIGQSRDTQPFPPVLVDVDNPSDCPLIGTVEAVDSVSPAFQTVNFSLTNVGSEPIRAYVIQAHGRSGKALGNVLTVVRTTDMLGIGRKATEHYLLERSLVENEGAFHLSIDYVEFANGLVWGPDANGRSRMLEANREGGLAALQRYKEALANGDEKWLSQLPDAAVASLDSKYGGGADEWSRNFTLGFRSVFVYLVRVREQSPQDLPKAMTDLKLASQRVGKPHE